LVIIERAAINKIRKEGRNEGRKETKREEA
jgi:hypothetical protein